VTAARTHFKLVFHRQVISLDIPEIFQTFPECREDLDEVMARIQSRRDEMDPKTGRLQGTFSASFMAGPEDVLKSGRVVYALASPKITIWAAYPIHDEAYRRARARYRRQAWGGAGASPRSRQLAP